MRGSRSAVQAVRERINLLTCSIRLIDHRLYYSPPRIDKPKTKAYRERDCQQLSKSRAR